MKRLQIQGCKIALTVGLLVGLAVSAKAQDITGTFTNLNFDLCTQDVYAGINGSGFDVSGADVVGWQNTPATLADSGVQTNGAWWSPYIKYSAFEESGDGAYDLSSYTIKAGDVFDVGLMAKGWAKYANTPGATLTISLFYGSDPTQNLIGSFNTGVLTQGDTYATWAPYSSTIAATAGSVGQTLGVSVVSSGAASSYANFDSVTVAIVPEPASMALMALGGGMGLMFWRRRRAK